MNESMMNEGVKTDDWNRILSPFVDLRMPWIMDSKLEHGLGLHSKKKTVK
jgi:hypothetical protein